MAVYSMTGYAMVQGALPSGTGDDTGLQLGLEMRSVNSRFLDVSFKLGDDLRAAEPALRELVGQRLKRGKVELRAWVEGRGTGQALTPSDTALKRLHLAQATVLQTFPQAQPLSVSQVLQWGQQRDSDTSDWPQQLLRFATEAVDQLLASRQREGQRLADTLLDRTRQLRSLAQTAQPLIPQLVEQQRLRFLERWHEALGQTGLSSDAAQDRALTEATHVARNRVAFGRPLIDMPLQWVASPQRLGDLAPRGRRRAIGPADIAHLPILTNPSPSNLYVSIADWFSTAGRQPGRLITCNSLGIMARLACDGTGLSLLPVGILREEIGTGRLVILPSRPPIAPHQASVAYRRDMPGSSLAQLARLISEIAHDSELAHYRPTS